MPYIPHSDDDIRIMLDTIGAKSIDDLFDEIPAHLKAGRLQNTPEGLSEMEVMRLMSERAAQDAGVLNFIGAGAYEHHVPAAVWEIATRGEFYTAYTPYQAEASQGTLQVIYEYQSMMAHLTAMDVSNASVYDGASGLSEAVLMAIRANRKSKSRKILIAGNVNPLYKKATHDIVHNQQVTIEEVGFASENGCIDFSALEKHAGEDYAALVIQQPNFFGAIEDVDALTNWAHEQKMLVIAVVNPTSLAVLNPPGEWGDNGADIVTGDGQPLGIPLSSGGPYFGFLCCKQAIVRQMPGRIIGRTVDLDGKPGFALTLQAREQHIRRSKATSNICTNQGLAMTAATIYMSLLGAEGLENVASACHRNLNSLLEKITALSDVSVKFSGPHFHEIVIETNKPASDVLAAMSAENVIGGLALNAFYPEMENAILLCTTETRTEADIDAYVSALSNAVNGGA